MGSRKVITSIVSSVLTILLLVFAFRYFKTLINQVQTTDFTISWAYVTASGVLFLVFYGLLSLHWLFACRLVARDAPQNQWLVFFASQPYKYLPTSLFTFSFRGVYAKKLGMSFKKSSVSQLLENLSLMISNFFIVAVLFAARVNLLFAVVVCVGGGLFVWLLLKKKTWVVRLKGREFNVLSVKLVQLLALAVIAWLIAGTAFVLLNLALDIQIDIFGFVLANTLAFSLGILAVFAPGGIGVREVVYNFFGVAAGAIIAWRMLTFVLDCTLGLLAIIAIKYKNVE